MPADTDNKADYRVHLITTLGKADDAQVNLSNADQHCPQRSLCSTLLLVQLVSWPLYTGLQAICPPTETEIEKSGCMSCSTKQEGVPHSMLFIVCLLTG